VFVDASSKYTSTWNLLEWNQSFDPLCNRNGWDESHAIMLLDGGLPTGRWLLIFDGANDPDMLLSHFIPESRYGTIIITSQNQKVGLLATQHHLEMSRMQVGDAVSVLLLSAYRRSQLPEEERQSAESIVSRLGYLPLSIAHAGAYYLQQTSLMGIVPLLVLQEG